MVGTLANASLAWHRVSNGVERHCFMKPLSWDKQLGLVSPLEYAAIQGGKTKGPSRRDTGLDASHHIQGLPRGEAENFFLDILSHRITYTASSQTAGFCIINVTCITYWQ